MRFEQLEYPLASYLSITVVINVVTICTAWINRTGLTICHTVHSRLYDPHRKQRLFRYRTLASLCRDGDCVFLWGKSWIIIRYSQKDRPSEGKTIAASFKMLVRTVNPNDAIGDQLIYRHQIASSQFRNMSYTCQSFPHVLAGGRQAHTGMPIVSASLSARPPAFWSLRIEVAAWRYQRVSANTVHSTAG
jgi:hypothetical protein